MALDVRLFACLSDNYGFLVRDRASGRVAAIDAPDADAILADLASSGWGRLDMVLNTHWHPDHTQGNLGLQAQTGCDIVGPEEVRRVAPLDRAVGEGDRVDLGETAFEVMATPGHTLGHVVYRDAASANAFVGDALFPLGCGRMFEGEPNGMWNGLRRMASWPEATLVWCAHEYAMANAKFAVSVDDRPDLATHVAMIAAARARGEPTAQTTIRLESRFNPFLRAPNAETFARLRAAKDVFAG